MSERLYAHYNEELAFIREEVQQYVGRFSKVATRLRLSADSVEDPHVSRLIDSFALLTARLRLKIEDEFPEICQAFLQALYPQYLAPIPSLAIARFELRDIAAGATTGLVVPKGALVESEEVGGQACYFQTCFENRLYPLQVRNVSFLKPPFTVRTEPTWADRCDSAIRIDLAPSGDGLDWKKLQVENLRFFVGGLTSCANKLFEALLHDTLGLGVYSSRLPQGVFLSSDCVFQTGFGRDQALVHFDARTLPAYQLMWEFFAIPEKFRFIEIDLKSVWSSVSGDALSLVVFLKKAHPIIQRQISRDAMQLGCSPIINLFQQEAEPINLTENQVEYHVVPSYRDTSSMEVHSILSVESSRSDGNEPVVFLPFHQPSHRLPDSDGRFWQMSRRRRMDDDIEGDQGTEVFLTVVDLQGRPKPQDEWTLHVRTLCCNRDLVSRLSVQSRLAHGGGPIGVSFATPPLPTRRPIDDDDWTWRLLSHLTLNHLALEEDSGAELLREILRLYTSDDAEEAWKLIDGILSIQYRRINARVPTAGKGPGICRGLEIHVEIDEEILDSVGVYLFATVLDQFFSLFVTINSFTRLRVRARGKTQWLYEGRPRAGTKFLI